MCHNAPDTAAVAFEGLQMAVRECQHQFRWNRWNCSSLSVKSANPHASAIMRRGKYLPIIRHTLIHIYHKLGIGQTNIRLGYFNAPPR